MTTATTDGCQKKLLLNVVTCDATAHWERNASGNQLYSRKSLKLKKKNTTITKCLTAQLKAICLADVFLPACLPADERQTPFIQQKEESDAGVAVVTFYVVQLQITNFFYSYS